MPVHQAVAAKFGVRRDACGDAGWQGRDAIGLEMDIGDQKLIRCERMVIGAAQCQQQRQRATQYKWFHHVVAMFSFQSNGA